MQYFRAITKTAGGTGNGGYPSPNGAPVPPPWLFPIWSNGGGGYLTVSPTYIAFDLTGNGIARINVGTGPHQQWSGNSINPAGTYLDPNSYLGPYDAALRAEAVSQNESGLYVYSAGPLVPQIQQTVVRSGTCPGWSFADGTYAPSIQLTFTAAAGYNVNGSGSQTSPIITPHFDKTLMEWGQVISISCVNGYPIVGTQYGSSGSYANGLYLAMGQAANPFQTFNNYQSNTSGIVVDFIMYPFRTLNPNNDTFINALGYGQVYGAVGPAGGPYY